MSVFKINSRYFVSSRECDPVSHRPFVTWREVFTRRCYDHFNCRPTKDFNMKRIVSEAKQECAGMEATCVYLNDWCPHVAEYLTCVKYDDGTVRETSTLTVFIDMGVLKVSLNDRDMRRSLYVTAPDLETALKTLEAACVKPEADWRPWKGSIRKK